MNTTKKTTQNMDMSANQRSQDQLRSDREFDLYEAVDVRGVKTKDGYQWHPGCYILHREFRNNQWWYAITRPYQGDKNITQLSYPVAYTKKRLRPTENPTPIKVTGGIYKSDEFLQHYGGAIMRSALNAGLIFVE